MQSRKQGVITLVMTTMDLITNIKLLKKPNIIDKWLVKFVQI